MPKRRDDVPAAPVGRILAAWMWRNGHAPPGYELVYGLAERLRMDESYLVNIVKGKHQNIPFDRADRILCAIDCQFAWHTEPELAECYEAACKGADALEACAGMTKGERDLERIRWGRRQKALAA